MADFSPAPVAGLFLRSRNQPCGWALGWWVCRLTGRPCWLHLKDLNLAPLAPLRCGAFVWHPPARAVQPTLQLGVGGGGLPLMIWPLGGKLHQTVWTNLAPSPWRGFFCDLPCAVQPSASAPLIAVGLLVTFAEWQPRDGTAPNWPGANGRPLRGCRSRSRARQVSRRASTIAHGLRSSSCKLRRPAPHIASRRALGFDRVKPGMF
jgi:hypothetical protein